MKMSRAKMERMALSGAVVKSKAKAPETKAEPKATPSKADEMRVMAEAMAKQMQQKHNGKPITYKFETERDEDGRIKSITATPVCCDDA